MIFDDPDQKEGLHRIVTTDRYRYLDRAVSVGISILISILLLRPFRGLTPAQLIVFIAIPLSGFFAVGSKPYWFLFGIASGSLFALLASGYGVPAGGMH